MSPDRRIHCRSTAVERHMQKVEPEGELEQFGRQLCRLPRTSRCVTVLAGICFHQRDQFLQVVRRERRVDHQDVRRRHRQSDRGEIPDRIISQLGIEARIDDEARGHDEHCIAVRRGLRGGGGADVARTGRQVLHIERLTPSLGQRLRDDVRQHGGGAAGCEWHDDPHGTRGIGLRPRGPRYGGRRGGGAGKAQEVTTNELHRVLLRTRSFACACSQHRQKRTSVY